MKLLFLSGSDVGSKLGNPTQLNPNAIPASAPKPEIISGVNGQNTAVFKPQNNNNTLSSGNAMVCITF